MSGIALVRVGEFFCGRLFLRFIVCARDRIALGGGMVLLLVLRWLLVVLSASLIT